eukprot:TRINITY_DN8834_c0_g1_i1.p1 TRINITY_DN8834_c0_g1~~TRINITY_DN8834_c0_g1_i1.p1  ORF type:complete len:1466 (+),score=441.69 TRINITY_DN8834_c0_g1_i1:183-4580(+)
MYASASPRRAAAPKAADSGPAASPPAAALPAQPPPPPAAAGGHRAAGGCDAAVCPLTQPVRFPPWAAVGLVPPPVAGVHPGIALQGACGAGPAPQPPVMQFQQQQWTVTPQPSALPFTSPPPPAPAEQPRAERRAVPKYSRQQQSAEGAQQPQQPQQQPPPPQPPPSPQRDHRPCIHPMAAQAQLAGVYTTTAGSAHAQRAAVDPPPPRVEPSGERVLWETADPGRGVASTSWAGPPGVGGDLPSRVPPPTRERLSALIKAAFQLRMVNGRPSRIAFDLPSRRLYWLQTQPTTGRNALFCCELSPMYEALEQRRRVGARSDRPTELQLPATVVLPSLPSLNSITELSREEQLLRERKRVGSCGIAEFVACFEHRAILLPGDSTVYLLRTGPRSTHPLYDVLGRSGLAGPVSDAKLAPTAPHLLSFIHQDDIYVCDITALDESFCVQPPSGDVDEPPEGRPRKAEALPGLPLYQLTHGGGSGGFTGCGTADYLTQEEFNRYSGYWWAPVTGATEGGGRLQRILYIYTDERHVGKVQVASTDPEAQHAEEFAMPRPGEMNMRPSLCMLSFPEADPSAVTYYALQRQDLLRHVPWFEYISKAGWTHQGDVYIEVLDRHQERVALLTVPLARFEKVASELDGLPPAVTREEQLAFRTPGRAIHHQALGVQSDPTDAADAADPADLHAADAAVAPEAGCASPWAGAAAEPAADDEEATSTVDTGYGADLDHEGGERADADDAASTQQHRNLARRASRVSSAASRTESTTTGRPPCPAGPGGPCVAQSQGPAVVVQYPCAPQAPAYPAGFSSTPFGVAGTSPFGIIVSPSGCPYSPHPQMLSMLGMMPNMMPVYGYAAGAVDPMYLQQQQQFLQQSQPPQLPQQQPLQQPQPQHQGPQPHFVQQPQPAHQQPVLFPAQDPGRPQQQPLQQPAHQFQQPLQTRPRPDGAAQPQPYQQPQQPQRPPPQGFAPESTATGGAAAAGAIAYQQLFGTQLQALPRAGSVADQETHEEAITGYSVRPAKGSGWVPSASFPFEVIREDVFPDGWVNVADTVHFFTDGTGRVVFESEASGPGGYRHLFLYDPAIGPPALQVTKGEWQVDVGGPKGGGGLWVDEWRGIVYFSGTYHGWLEQHLYYVTLPTQGQSADQWQPCMHPTRLSDPGLTHACIAVCPDFLLYATCHSSLNTHPTLSVRSCDNSVQATVTPRYPIHASFRLTTPRLLSLPNKAGILLQTAFYPPVDNTLPKVPLVVLVYGGTEVQQVTNDYRLVCQPRLQMLCQLGYACCMIDNQGSARRGNAFEAALKHRLGQVEVQDQIDVIEELGRQYPYLDLRRVAIYGWSYGGYIALMSIGTRPDFFRMALAGAPVVDWRLYNSAYTERYMGTPHTNPTGYERGRVTEYVKHFPNEHDRVVLFNGMSDENVHFCHTQSLITALIRHGKPYRLQIYPGERHGLKHSDVSFHHEQEWLETVLRFL